MQQQTTKLTNMTKQQQSNTMSENDKKKKTYNGLLISETTHGVGSQHNPILLLSPFSSHHNNATTTTTAYDSTISKMEKKQKQRRFELVKLVCTIGGTVYRPYHHNNNDDDDSHDDNHDPVALSSSSSCHNNKTAKTTTTTKQRPIGSGIKKSVDAKRHHAGSSLTEMTKKAKTTANQHQPQHQPPPQQQSSSASSSSSQDDDSMDDDDSMEDDDDDDDESVIPSTLTNEEMEQQVAFCCYVCRCSQQHKAQIPINNCFAQSHRDSLYHRRCCHNLVQLPKHKWKTPIEMAMKKRKKKLLTCPNKKRKTKPPPPNVAQKANLVLWKDIEESCRAKDKLSVAHDPTKSLRRNSDYCMKAAEFVTKLNNRNKPAVVLDLFAGIGSGIVALKRLGISIERVIHVEQDRVATMVYQRNHDRKCAPEAGMEHVYFDNVRYVEKNLEAILERHGYVDIVLGAPPCLIYNSDDSDDVSQQPAMKYLRLMATLTRTIQEYQAEMEEGSHVYFLAEATAVSGGKYVGLRTDDRTELQKAFGISWSVEVDAGLFSPVRRTSTIFSNIPIVMEESDFVEPDGSACLMENYMHGGWQPCPTARFPSFMTDKDKLDDDRMVVFYKGSKTEEPRYWQRTLNPQERSNLMGFPSEYVHHPVHDLFTMLLDDGFVNIAQSQKYWKDVLAEEYHCYSGVNYKFVVASDQHGAVEVKLEMPVPSTLSKDQVFLNADQYAKYLLGGASSIPLWMILLRELCEKFEYRVYPSYEYEYMWTTTSIPQQRPWIKSEKDDGGHGSSDSMVKCEEDDDGGIDV